jgi:uncharacterized protein YjdB
MNIKFFKYFITMRKVLLLALVCLVGMTGCKNEDDNEKEVVLTGIKVNPATFQNKVGTSVTVTATPEPADAELGTLTWVSSNTDVATVTDDGTITIQSVGDATVTVSSGSISSNIAVKGIDNPVLELRVSEEQENITLAVDDSVKIVVTAYPADADNIGDYVWTSADENIATVKPDGTVVIRNVGTTTITVTMAGLSKEITVTGIAAGIKVVDNKNAGSSVVYVGLIKQLYIVLLPERIDEAFNEGADSWSSNNTSVATVDATGKVIIVGEGTATITATLGELTATYTVSTGHPLGTAYGYWTFDDPAQWGKATFGSDLTVQGTVSQVDGPSPENIAIEGTRGQRNLVWLHEKPEGGLPNGFTMMWDTRFHQTLEGNPYYCLYWNGGVGSDASFFVRSWATASWGRDGMEWTNVLNIGKGGYYPWYFASEDEIPTEPGIEGTKLTKWVRLIVTMDLLPDNDEGKYSVYVNGEVVSYPTTEGTAYVRGISMDGIWRFTWGHDRPIYFDADGGGDGLEGGDGDDTAHPIAAIAVWDKVLTEEEIAILGGVE